MTALDRRRVLESKRSRWNGQLFSLPHIYLQCYLFTSWHGGRILFEGLAS